MNKQEYNEVYVVSPEIYTLGGPDVFKHLEHTNSNKKNLIVITQDILQRMGSLKRSTGSTKVLEALDGKKPSPEKSCFTDGMSVYEIYEGLDIAVGTKNLTTANTSDLESRIKEKWDIVNKEKNKQITFISENPQRRLTLKSQGLRVEKPQFLYSGSDLINQRGIVDISPSSPLAQKLYEAKDIPLEEVITLNEQELHLNECVRVRGRTPQESFYGRVHAPITWSSRGKIKKIGEPVLTPLGSFKEEAPIRVGTHYRSDLFGISPRDMEQYIALQHGILNPDVTALFLTGGAGSGKTLLSFLGAIDQTLWYDKPIRQKRNPQKPNTKGARYDQFVLLKPTNVLGGDKREMGFLPGNEFDKLRPFLAPYIDALKESDLSSYFLFEDLLKHPLFETKFGHRENNPHIHQEAYFNPKQEMFEMTYSGFMRGRSFTNTLMLVDEAQDYTPYELKTIFERLGPHSKIIVMGDPVQTDNSDCSQDINGLTSMVKHYIDKPYSMLIHLPINYRSPMSDDARNLPIYSK